MKFTRIEATSVRVPLKQPYSVLRNEYLSSEHVVVKAWTDAGVLGIAETPGFAKPEIMLEVLEKYLGPAVMGEDPREPAMLHQSLDRAIPGYHSTKNAIDIAAFDITGKVAGMSIAAVLGGKLHNRVPVADVIGLVPPEQAAAEAKKLMDEGYFAIKLKGGRDFRRDLRTVELVREACGTDFEIRIDLNTGYQNAAFALPRCHKLAEAGADILEQPIAAEDLKGMAHLVQRIAIPILAHESLATLADAVQIIELGAADILNVSPPKAGGLYPASQIVTLAEANHIPVMIAGAMEGGPGTVAAAQLAARCENQQFAGDTRTVLRNTESLVNEEISINAGWCHLPTGPGLGISLDEDAVEAHRTSPWVVIDDED